MKVSELIELLQEQDPDQLVMLEIYECGEKSPMLITDSRIKKVTWRKGYYDYCSKTATKKVTEAFILIPE